MYSTAELIILARAYIAATDVPESTLSTHAFGNDKTVTRLFGGFDCTMRSAERAATWFVLNWPIGVDWPSGVARRRHDRARRDRAAENLRPR